MTTASPQHKRLHRADQLGDKHVGRNVKAGTLTGRLVALIGQPRGGVELELRVGSNEARAWVLVEGGVGVEVWRD